uniref:D(4) dopamine receptor isoform X2 n=1 Tax=Myxine glutinosa TaxID=7769 RepID=UPI00358F227B
MTGGNTSEDGAAASPEYNYVALVVGVLLIVIVILGNVLVCLSVLTEKSLKTATNYFIVSLAAADLLLALLVLPLFVHSEFLGGVWMLGTEVCDALMAMDVMLCTASILNLCAIGVDRCIAVLVPLQYNKNHFGLRQMILITATWVLSMGLASPIMFGLNDGPVRDPKVCKLESNNFVVYSSVCSYFVPCPLMLVLYCCMFRGLRKWRQARKTLAQHRQSRSHGPQALKSGCSPACSIVILQDLSIETRRLENSPQQVVRSTACWEEGSSERNGVSWMRERAVRRTVQSRRVNGREQKAMKVLPIVVGVFLACWTPFFVVHVTAALCPNCLVSARLTSVVTWLGYVNSGVNPFIYTAFNPEFRHVFRKIICFY